MDFGDNFLSLTDPRLMPPLDADVAADPTRMRATLESAISMIRGRGTVYVPPVGDGVCWIDVGSPLVIPPTITLHVAHGVKLLPVVQQFFSPPGVLLENALEIQGGFRAPIGQVFIPPQRFAALAGAARALAFRLGRVRFASRSMERVYAEWWGAGATGDHDSDALDEAVRAAVHDRYEMRGTSRQWLRPLVLELPGTYRLARPLLIARFARRGPDGVEANGGVELRGAPGSFDVPTFSCHEAFPSDSYLLTINGFESSTLDEVRFDGALKGVGQALGCLNYYADTRAKDRADAAPPASGHLLRRCGFAGARQHLVRLWVQRPGSPNASAALPDRLSVQVEGCVFRPSVTATTPRGETSTAMWILTDDTVSVDVRGCVFEGAASAMIYAHECALSVTNSQFRNDAPSNTGQGDSVGGSDIVLDHAGGSPATLYAQDCRSSSPQFLRTSDDRDGGFCCGSTVVALHHTREGDVPSWPVIEWRVPTNHAPRAGLTVIGCRFDRSATASDAVVQGASGTEVRDIGTFVGTPASAAALVQVAGGAPIAVRTLESITS